MNALDQLHAYLARLEARMRLFSVSRGAAVIAAAALIATVILVMITNSFAFSTRSLFYARILLFLCLATAVAFGLVIPLLRLNRRAAARSAERRFPEFEQRLLTVAEKSERVDPFAQLLASDALRIAQTSEPQRLAPNGSIFGLFTSAGTAVAVLLWLILAGPGYFGYGSQLLWAGAPKLGAPAFYDILVSPGDHTVRRKADQLITAQLVGFNSPKVRLFARFKSASKWDEVPMLPQPRASAYEFLFGGLAESMEYYVAAGSVQSKHFNLRVVDLPGIQKMKVTYHLPAWAGGQTIADENGGDLRAVEGSEADVAILTDRPLPQGVLVFDDDTQIPLKAKDGNWSAARVAIKKDGMYHVAAIDQGELVRLSDDFFIEARKDNPPMVKFERPGRDLKVNPIEEVAISVQASDDFGLQEVALHYAVNGGPEKTIAMLDHKGVKEASGHYTLALEDYKLSPGDVVSMYATARDASQTTRSDIYFIEAQPFDRQYSQEQAGGGAGQGGEEEGNISGRQKEIIAATWNEIKNNAKDPANAAEEAKFLSDLEAKLGQQAATLAERIRARRLDTSNPQFQTYVKEMEQASTAAVEATAKIKGVHWNDALAPEEKVLQHALRAEAVFRDIKVAFGQQGGGQSQANAGRDLENLADLELDTEKNQYETGQHSAADKRQKAIDEAMQKLAELAKRQQELTQKKDSQQNFRQRWEQEMLRREAEQLQRKMEQLSRNDNGPRQQGSQQQQGQQGQDGQQSQQQGQQGSQRNQTGRAQSTNDPRLRQALDQLSRAADDMRNAAQQNPQQAEAAQRRAAERLNEARNLLNGMQQQQASEALDEMARTSAEMAARQHDFQNRLRQTYGSGSQSAPPGAGQQQAQALAKEKDKMAQDLKGLEQQMSDGARKLTDTQPGVSSQLRQALGEAQQNELELRMRKAADALRQGLGAQTWIRESTTTQGLDRLNEQIHQAQSAMRAGAQPGKGANSDLEKALAQVERMRERMQQAAGQPGQRGQQPGQQPGQQGQQGQQGQRGQQPGQQPGGQPGDSNQGGNQGSAQPGTWTPGTGGSMQQHNGYLPDALRDLNQARRLVQGEADLTGQFQQLSDDMRRINAFGNDAEMAARIRSQLIPEIERLELELRRKVDQQQSGQVRSAGSDRVPAGYADAVADYFRKLSKSK